MRAMRPGAPSTHSDWASGGARGTMPSPAAPWQAAQINWKVSRPESKRACSSRLSGTAIFAGDVAGVWPGQEKVRSMELMDAGESVTPDAGVKSARGERLKWIGRTAEFT